MPCGLLGSGIRYSSPSSTAVSIRMTRVPPISSKLPAAITSSAFFQLMMWRKSKLFLEAPASIGSPMTVSVSGSKSAPGAISTLKEPRNAQPSLTSFPASARSCVYGGISIWKLSSMLICPVSWSIFSQAEAPRNFSPYSVVSA